MNLRKTMLATVAAGMSAAAFADASYSDAYIETDDASVQRIAIGETEMAYVFTNATLESVNVTFKQTLTFTRCLLVGGGGSGGGTLGGGGGGGGVVDLTSIGYVYANDSLSLTVGAGALPNADAWQRGYQGGNSTITYPRTLFSALAYGGAGGSGWSGGTQLSGTYGSGGGCACNGRTPQPSGARYQGHVTTADGTTFNGYPGGKSVKVLETQYANAGGGGGGAGGPGGDSGGEHGGDGGLGVTNDITGVEVEYAAGGGGGVGNGVRDPGLAGGVSAGAGGKWNGNGGPTAGEPAPDGFGGGGGGGGYNPAKAGGKGGAGTVILRLSTVVEGVKTLTVTSVGSGSVTMDGEPEDSRDYPVGAHVPLVATPAEGWRFGYWSGDLSLIEAGTKVSASITVLNAIDGATLIAHFVPAATTWTDVTDGRLRLVIDVADTVEAGDWLAAQNPPASDVAPFDDIFKRGAGTLVVTNAVFGAFRGNFLIEAGRVKTSVADPLGPPIAGNLVRVESNATLHVVGKTSADKAFGYKPVYFAGEGTDGKGAIWEERSADNASQETFRPRELYLTGDGLAMSEHQLKVVGNIHLEGHTLKVCGKTDWDSWQPYIYDSTGYGHLEVIRGVLFFAWFGNCPNGTVTFKNGSFFRPYNTHITYPWTMVFEGNSYLQPASSNSWVGPVVLKDGSHRFTRQGGYNWPVQTFFGRVSGEGGFGASNNSDETILALMNTENTFEGGVYLKKNSLRLGGNGSLPAAGGPLTCVNGSVQFCTAAEFHDLPAADFSGTGRVFSAGAAWTRGAWRTGVTKDAAGELEYASLVGSPLLDVKGGGVCFPVTDAAAELPDFTNVCVRSGAYVRFGDGWDGTWAVTNLTGAGTVSNGNVRVDGAFAVSDDIASGGHLDVHAGTLTFGDGAQVRVADTVGALLRTAALSRGTIYTLAEADAITGVPRRTDEKGWYAMVEDVSGGRQRLQLAYIAGTQVILR